MKLGETTKLRFGEGRESRGEHFGPGEADPPGAAISLRGCDQRHRSPILAGLATDVASGVGRRNGSTHGPEAIVGDGRSMARTHLELDSRQGPLPVLAREGPGIRGTS